jgi:hypothetical protein
MHIRIFFDSQNTPEELKYYGALPACLVLESVRCLPDESCLSLPVCMLQHAGISEMSHTMDFFQYLPISSTNSDDM